MRIIALQPALPHYRLDFFRRVYASFGARFTLFYSPTDLCGITAEVSEETWALPVGPIKPLLPGLEWQGGVLSIPVARGDILVVCGAPRTVSTLALIVKAKMKGARVVWWGHFWSATSKTWRFRLRMQMLKVCDGILFYSENEVEEYLSRRSRPEIGPVEGLNNGINTEPIEAVRAPFDPAQRDNAILFIGRLTPKAQLPLALEALADIPSGLRPRLEVIGAGEERELLVRQSKALGVSDFIQWHGAITDEARIGAIANRCRLFVYPGEVGLSLIHAMAYGLPAIVHSDRWRQMPEFAAFESGATGREFQYGQASSLASVIESALTDESALSAYSAAAIMRVTHTFNTRDMAARFVSMIEGLCRGDGGAVGGRVGPQGGKA